MKPGKPEPRTRYYSGSSMKVPVMRLRLSMLKYMFRKSSYPLFRVNSSGTGIISTNRIQRKLGLCKFTRFGEHCYFSLNVPHWPSEAFDRMAARGGLNITAAGTPLKEQTDTVILGITRRCEYGCSHCYERFNIGEKEKVPVETWEKVIRQIQERGANVITLSGGEPMMRYDEVIRLLRSANHSLSDFHVHTSGFGVTPERALELKKAGLNAAGIGLDHADPGMNDDFRGYSGAFGQAVKAIDCFRNAGVFTYVNFCPSRSIIRSGEIFRFMRLMKELKVGFVRWLEPRPCGGYSENGGQILLEENDRQFLKELYFKLNTDEAFSVYPPVSWEAFYEAPENLGCGMAGNTLLYIDSLGNVLPCVFLPVSFGNITDEELPLILNRIRKAVPVPLHTSCPSLLLCDQINKLRNTGVASPVPYEMLKEEFSELTSGFPKAAFAE